MEVGSSDTLYMVVVTLLLMEQSLIMDKTVYPKYTIRQERYIQSFLGYYSFWKQPLKLS
jgi:hypothetical protein